MRGIVAMMMVAMMAKAEFTRWGIIMIAIIISVGVVVYRHFYVFHAAVVAFENLGGKDVNG